MPGGNFPQVAIVPWQNNVGGTDKDTEVTLMAVPDGALMSVEVLGVGFVAHTLGTTLVMDLESVDDSDSDSVTTHASAVSLVGTARVNTQVWNGKVRLDPGDSFNAECTVTDSGTMAGPSFVVVYRVVEWSGE